MKADFSELFGSELHWMEAFKLALLQGPTQQEYEALSLYLQLREWTSAHDPFVQRWTKTLRRLTPSLPRIQAIPEDHNAEKEKQNSWKRTFSTCRRALAQIEFPHVENSNGQKYVLDVANCGHLLRESDSILRRNALHAWNNALEIGSAEIWILLKKHLSCPSFQTAAFDGVERKFYFQSEYSSECAPLLLAQSDEKLPFSDLWFAQGNEKTFSGGWRTAASTIIEALSCLNQNAASTLKQWFLCEGGQRVIDISENPNALPGAECLLTQWHGPWLKILWDGSPTAALFLAHELGHAFELALKEQTGAKTHSTSPSEFMSSLAEHIGAQAMGISDAFFHRWSVVRFLWQWQLQVFQFKILDMIHVKKEDFLSKEIAQQFQNHLQSWFGHRYQIPNNAGFSFFGCTPLFQPLGPRAYVEDWAAAFQVSELFSTNLSQGKKEFEKRFFDKRNNNTESRRHRASDVFHFIKSHQVSSPKSSTGEMNARHSTIL